MFAIPVFVNNRKSIMNAIKSLNFIRNLYKCRPLMSRHFSSSGVKDSDLIDEDLSDALIDERTFADLKSNQFASLTTNETQLSEIESILSHYEHKKYSTMQVPSTLSLHEMKNLLEMSNWRQRDTYLRNLYRREIKILIIKKAKELAKMKTQQRLEEKYSRMNNGRNGVFNYNGDVVYGLWHNSLFTRISRQNVNRLVANKLQTSAIFGQKIIIDMTCDESLKVANCISKVDQLLKTYQANRRLKEPFDLNFCNIDYNSIIWETIQKKSHVYSNLPHFMSSFSQKSYLDLYDRKSLVYLTPMATKDLDYDCHKTYIISFSDGTHPKSYERLKARKELIPFRRLPLDRHVFWKGHTKDLKSFEVLNILNEIRNGVDWKTAIENNVHSNFLKPLDVIERENAYRLSKLKRYEHIKRKFTEN